MILESVILNHVNGVSHVYSLNEPLLPPLLPFPQKLAQSRQAAAYCSHSLFSFSHVPSRYVCLIACGDSQLEVREEGICGLRPRRDEHNPQFPPLTDMIEYISIRVSYL